MIEDKYLTSEERAIFSLRKLYNQFGYLPFCMSKFEEYDLYRENKEFLMGEGVIAFNDTDGRLLALKPDVTLSIIKNTKDESGCVHKVCYNENVYRISEKTHRYKEIMQAGLECIGDTDIYDICEVLTLALGSLATVSDEFVLDISHMGILSSVLDGASDSLAFKEKMIKLLSGKNRHEAEHLCREYLVSEEKKKDILSLFDICGDYKSSLEKLSPICERAGAVGAYNELSDIGNLLAECEYFDRVRIDFSVVNDMNYYSGIVFKGFIVGVYEGILSGGEYGKLMRKMGRVYNALGFALYLDLLDMKDEGAARSDVDVLILYDEKSDTGALIKKRNELISEGKSVSVQRCIPERLRYREMIKI